VRVSVTLFALVGHGTVDEFVDGIALLFAQIEERVFQSCFAVLHHQISGLALCVCETERYVCVCIYGERERVCVCVCCAYVCVCVCDVCARVRAGEIVPCVCV